MGHAQNTKTGTETAPFVQYTASPIAKTGTGMGGQASFVVLSARRAFLFAELDPELELELELVQKGIKSLHAHSKHAVLTSHGHLCWPPSVHWRQAAAQQCYATAVSCAWRQLQSIDAHMHICRT